MFFKASAALLALQFVAAITLPTEQIPLHGSSEDVQEIRAKLVTAEIIPTVVDDFLPSLSLSVSWTKKSTELGNTIKPKHVQDQPSITLHDETRPDEHPIPSSNYVVTLTDPDAPSRDDPKWSQICHWIVANVSLSHDTYSILPVSFDNKQEEEAKRVDEVMPYKAPGPPPKTGKHRYVFLVFAPKNGTTETLYLTKPKDRQHWGTGEVRGGVREWSKENGLVAVGANFMYSQNKKQ